MTALRVADDTASFDDAVGERQLAPLVVVIAAYNEQDAIGAVVGSIPRQVCGLDTDIVVVVDGSTDETASAARAAGALVRDVPVNRGQGAALRLGYRLAADHGAQYIATLDADGQYDPAQLERVVGPLVDDEADFVSGSRRLGDTRNTDRFRNLGVVVFGAVITALTRRRITDPANGLRAMRVSVPRAVPLEQPQYQAAELLVGTILHGFRVVEVPTTMYRRQAGSTKKGRNLAYGLRFARVIARTWWRDRAHKDH
jgi:glycosyltransferase involved in cell wall biosynthesis